MKSHSKEIDEFTAACHEVARHNLVRCSSGNLSCRLKDGLVLIKASRAWMANATRADVCVCRLSDGRILHGNKPSAEVDLHLATLRNRPDCNIVLHFQTPFATTIACRRGPAPNYNILPEIPFYIGPVASVPYFPPGSPRLAKAVSEALKRHNLVQMLNHGQAVTAVDFAHAIQDAAFFELACEIIVRNNSRTRKLPRHPIASDAGRV
jgi:ribulose-5-phosphate 4-epimerase/fuculose-1-phosphate aldolase